LRHKNYNKVDKIVNKDDLDRWQKMLTTNALGVFLSGAYRSEVDRILPDEACLGEI
jgi:hypothetical protein